MNQPELQLRKNNTDMDVWEHVGELRRRLIRCVAAVALAFAVLVYIGPERVMNAVAAPVKEQGVQLIYLGLADALYVQLKVVFLCAVVLAAPVLLWQMWAFVRPALYPEERKLAIGWAVFSLLLFATGVAFGYGVVFLSALSFFVYAGAGTAMPLFAIDRYVNFLLGFVIPFGLIFEMPLACTIAAKAGEAATTAARMIFARRNFILKSRRTKFSTSLRICSIDTGLCAWVICMTSWGGSSITPTTTTVGVTCALQELSVNVTSIFSSCPEWYAFDSHYIF